MGRLLRASDTGDIIGRAVPLEHVNRRLQELVEAQALKTRFINDAREGLLALSLKIAKKIVETAVDTDSKTVDTIYLQAVNRVKELAPGTVRVSPLKMPSEQLQQKIKEIGFEIVKDAALAEGDCMVEASGVTVDARLETAVYHFKRVLDVKIDQI